MFPKGARRESGIVSYVIFFPFVPAFEFVLCTHSASFYYLDALGMQTKLYCKNSSAVDLKDVYVLRAKRKTSADIRIFRCCQALKMSYADLVRLAVSPFVRRN